MVHLAPGESPVRNLEDLFGVFKTDRIFISTVFKVPPPRVYTAFTYVLNQLVFVFLPIHSSTVPVTFFDFDRDPYRRAHSTSAVTRCAFAYTLCPIVRLGLLLGMFL